MHDPQFDDRLSAYLDNESSAEERASLERDLEQSPELRRQFDDFRQISDWLQDLPQHSLPSVFPAEVLQVVERRMLLESQPEPVPHSATSRPWRFPFMRAGSLLAAGVMLFVGIQFLNQQRAPQPIALEGAAGRDVAVNAAGKNGTAVSETAVNSTAVNESASSALVADAAIVSNGATDLRVEGMASDRAEAAGLKDGVVPAERAAAVSREVEAAGSAAPQAPALAANGESQPSLKREMLIPAKPQAAKAQAPGQQTPVAKGGEAEVAEAAEKKADQQMAKRKSVAAPQPAAEADSVVDAPAAPAAARRSVAAKNNMPVPLAATAPAAAKAAVVNAPVLESAQAGEATGWQVGQVIERIQSAGTAPGKVAVVQIFVIDHRKGVEEMQLVLKNNSISPQAAADKSGKAAKEAGETGDEEQARQPELQAVFVTATREQLAEVLQSLKQQESIVDLEVEPAVEIAQLDPPTQRFFLTPVSGALPLSVSGAVVTPVPGAPSGTLKIGVGPVKTAPAAPGSAVDANNRAAGAGVRGTLKGTVQVQVNGVQAQAGEPSESRSRQMTVRAPAHLLQQAQADEKLEDSDSAPRNASRKEAAKPFGAAEGNAPLQELRQNAMRDAKAADKKSGEKQLKVPADEQGAVPQSAPQNQVAQHSVQVIFLFEERQKNAGTVPAP